MSIELLRKARTSHYSLPMPRSTSWRRQALMMAASACILLACSNHRPAQLPMSGMYKRSTARIEVSQIVIKDQHRRWRVHAVYLRVAQLAEKFAARRTQHNAQLTQVMSTPTLHLADVEQVVKAFERDQKVAFDEYISLQLELRELMTKNEFEKLGKFQ